MDGPGDNVVIFRSRNAGECRERSVVLTAMNIDHVVRRHAAESSLSVPEHRAIDALRQLEHYARENRDWPRRHPALPRYPLGLNGVLVCVVILLAVAAASGRHTFGFDWFGAGRIDTSLVRQGEWWRTVTALTLHLSVGHLVGNLILGSVFGLVAGRLLGGGMAWFSIILAGAVGNGVSGLVQPPPHHAVGASTAVFAALGLIAAYVWRRRGAVPSRWAVRWAPIIVAAILLAWTGSGSGRTDVVSHLSGFVTGIAFGAAYEMLAPDTIGPRSQWLFGLATIAIVVVAWAIALGSHG